MTPAKLYVISNGNSVKVGRAKNARQRMTFLQVGSAVPLELAHEVSVDDSVAVERAAHTLLSGKRQLGEWFGVTPDEAIAAIKEAIAIVERGEIEALPRERSQVETASQRYERSGRRPGVSISIRVSDEVLALIDKARGSMSRAAWLKEIVRKDLGIS